MPFWLTLHQLETHPRNIMNDSDEHCIEKQIKIVIVGEPSTGKTCLATRYCHDEFCRQYYPTAGIDFLLKRSVIQSDRHLRLLVWDVSGQALNSSMLDKYVFGANAVLLAFDITNPMTFSKITDWLNVLRGIFQERQPIFALVANKCDVEHQRVVPLEKQVQFATENGITSHNVSARTGENVALCFQRVSADCLGLRLTHNDQEATLNIVKAEISMANHNQTYAGLQTPPSTVCSMQ